MRDLSFAIMLVIASMLYRVIQAACGFDFSRQSNVSGLRMDSSFSRFLHTKWRVHATRRTCHPR